MGRGRGNEWPYYWSRKRRRECFSTSLEHLLGWSLFLRLVSDSLAVALSPTDADLSWPARQSKLSPSQLDELQKATHFDKKELQQWYKGVCVCVCEAS